MTGQVLAFVEYHPINMPNPEENDFTWIGIDKNQTVQKGRKFKTKAALTKQ